MLKNVGMIGALLGWVGLLVIGTTISATYENKPGDLGFAPQTAFAKQDVEPAKSSSTKFHIIMFVHPKCPCTRASIAELQDLMASFPDLKATLFFYRPSTMKAGWEKSETWRIAATNKNITCKVDVDGKKAKAYRIVTSGQVLLYDSNERLAFSGGITGARGHVGGNVGETMVNDILSKPVSTPGETLSAPVFGCRILKDGDQLCTAKTNEVARR